MEQWNMENDHRARDWIEKGMALALAHGWMGECGGQIRTQSKFGLCFICNHV